MTLSQLTQLMTLWPQIQAAFAAQGITISLTQAEAIAATIVPLFSVPAAPTPAPAGPTIITEPGPIPIPPPVAFVNLNVLSGVPGSLVSIGTDYGNGSTRTADGSGFANFGVPANTVQAVTVSANGVSVTISAIVGASDLTVTVPPLPSTVQFDHPWTGNVELALRALLASGLAGADGMNGQAVVNAMNAKGGIYAGGEFQQHHDGPAGLPTYGYPWFYVSYLPTSVYQIVEFGTPPAGN